MKGKIGIVTLYGCYNFGNRLQNYAVQKTFEKRGFEVETIIAERSQIRYWARHCKRIISGYCGNQTGKRYNTFYKFNKKVVPHSYFFGNNGQFTSDLADKYDFFVVGSDQVWNPELRKNERDNFFLSFAKRNQRICLSPSIAVDRIEDHYVSQFSAALNRFPYLSCRESTGAEEIRRITKKDCFHIIDPTLSLTCEEWQEFSSTVKVSENYIIIFFLGDISDERREVIREYCSKRKYEIIEPSNPNNKYYSISPNELVYLVDNAKMVFTDSFHLTAFSINMNTPFYVFDRHDKLDSSNKMNSRIKSLTKQFNLENRYVSGEEDFEITENCDFGETNAVLQQERDKYNHFLDICLEQ